MLVSRTDGPSISAAARCIHDQAGSSSTLPAGYDAKFVSVLVLLETDWGLHSRYRSTKSKIMTAMSGSLNAKQIQIDGEPVVEEVLSIPVAFEN